MEPIDASGADVRDRILDAALEEFRIRGIDDFSIDHVARRAGVDQEVIDQQWPDARVLLMDAQLTRLRQQIPAPDTGSLRGDLLALAASLSDLAETTQGRRWFHRNLPNNHDTDLLEVRTDFWKTYFDDIAAIFRRAAQRGELRPDVDALEAARMFSAAYYYDVIFADTPVRAGYAEQVVDTFLRGIRR